MMKATAPKDGTVEHQAVVEVTAPQTDNVYGLWK